jgi:HEAT repeat protein
VYNEAKSDKVREAALSALSMVPDPSSRPYFERAFNDGNDRVRAAAAEGFARLKNATDRARVARAFNDERKMPARLAQAFALVALGDRQTGELSALTYLVNTLNSRSYRGVAQPYLQELARDAEVRKVLAAYLRNGTSDEKIGIARVMAASGDKSSVGQIEWMMKDNDPEVAQEAIRAVRTLQSKAQ